MAGYFSIFLVLLTLGTGLIWLVDHFFFAPKRKEKVAVAMAAAGGTLEPEMAEKIAPEPMLTEQAKSIFPMIAAITIFRSFLFEPFQIPSGSMMPTLLVGDFILVQKYSYGIKDPVWRKQLIEVGEPQRGDMAVFKSTENENIDLIKRVIGLPGDAIVYRNKQLFIKPFCEEGQTEKDTLTCGQYNKIPLAILNKDKFFQQGTPLVELKETLGTLEHNVLINPIIPEFKSDYYQQPQTRIDEWVVPQGHYFMMGDNRDNSYDSRGWGFAPKESLVGKAVFIWMSFEFDRSPESILPSWVPTNVRFSRLGSIQ